MEWVTSDEPGTRRASAFRELAQRALETGPQSPWSILAAANSAFAERDFVRAGQLFAQLENSGIASRVPWDKVAQCHLEGNRVGQAWKACTRGLALQDPPEPSVSIKAGTVQTLLGNPDEARRHFLRAAEVGNYHEACWYILMEPARAKNGAVLLTQCDELEEQFGPSSVFRANRAIAFSLLGAPQKALELVDLDAHVRSGSLGEFREGDLAQFNAELVREALVIGDGAGSQEKTIVTHPDLSDAPAIQALGTHVRQAIDTYLAEAAQRGLETCLPLPLGKARLNVGVTLLRGNGSNGQHIHMTSAISAVYHIGIPRDAERHGHAGALRIGPVDQYTGGHMACWGERRIMPGPGHLTIFPAHFFHDVIPTQSSSVRISFPCDVRLL